MHVPENALGARRRLVPARADAADLGLHDVLRDRRRHVVASELAENAGFSLVARSEVNANPRDTADHPEGVWTLPPSLRLDETDREKYLAIGESDRMTLRFRR